MKQILLVFFGLFLLSTAALASECDKYEAQVEGKIISKTTKGDYCAYEIEVVLMQNNLMCPLDSKYIQSHEVVGHCDLRIDAQFQRGVTQRNKVVYFGNYLKNTSL